MSTTKLSKVFTRGFVKENPAFKQLLGLCPALAVTTSAFNGIGMGIATTAVLISSNFVISILRKLIPPKVRIPCYIAIISGFVTIIQLLLKAHLPSVDEALGIFIPLIVVNCVVLARAEIYASKNKVFPSLVDGLGMGLGFTFALLLIGAFREFLGNGTLFDLSITDKLFTPMGLMILPPGGFLALGIILALINHISHNKMPHKECKGCGMNCMEGETELNEEVL